MPWTLYKYITKEIVKLLALSVAVLMVVISMAAAIRPLTEGMLDPASFVKFVIYTAPTMLQFALPFAGAFAATLFFCRMAADNEVLACAASGMSYRSILLPVMFLGLMLMLGLYYLSNTVAPRFNQHAAALVEKDLIRMMVAKLSKGQAYNYQDKWVLYADAAEERAPTAQETREILGKGSNAPPFRVILLRHVALSMLGEDGQAQREGTAESANIFLFQDGPWTVATFYLHEVVYYDAQRQNLLAVRDWEVPALRIPSPILDSPQFLSGQALRELGRDPERYDKVRQDKQDLAQTMAAEELLRLIELSLHTPPRHGRATVSLQGVGEERYILSAPVVRTAEKGLVLEARQSVPVQVDLVVNGETTRRVEARSARLSASNDDPDPEPRVLLDLYQARVLDLKLNRSTEHQTLTLPRARWTQSVLQRLEDAPLNQLLALAEHRYPPAGPVAGIVQRIHLDSASLIRKIIAQMHQRASAAISCMLVLLLGAVLAMTLRGRQALVVFFWTFLLTLVVVIITQTGRTICDKMTFPVMLGVAVIWSGNLLLVGAIGLTYKKLAKN